MYYDPRKTRVKTFTICNYIATKFSHNDTFDFEIRKSYCVDKKIFCNILLINVLRFVQNFLKRATVPTVDNESVRTFTYLQF